MDTRGFFFNKSDNNRTTMDENSTLNISMSLQIPNSEVAAVIYIAIFILGSFGNALVIYIVSRYAKMKTVTNIYILNLAVADELYILGIPFTGSNSLFSYWPYGDFICKVYMTADGISQFASTFCMTLMSIDRFFAVVYPSCSAKWRKPWIAVIFCALIWVLSFFMVLPVPIYSQVLKDPIFCNIDWPHPKTVWSIAFILYTCIMGFFVPLVVISLCYLCIVIKVKSAGLRAGMTKRRKSERKVTRMVVTIVLVFVLCWLPFFTFNIVSLFDFMPDTEISVAIYFSLVILTYVNSCVNPILYSFLSDNFKQSYKKVLCFNKKKNYTTTNKNTNTVGARHNAGKSIQMSTNIEFLSSKPEMNGQ